MAPPGGSGQRQPETAVVNPPKAEVAAERSGKQAFLLKDKDSY